MVLKAITSGSELRFEAESHRPLFQSCRQLLHQKVGPLRRSLRLVQVHDLLGDHLIAYGLSLTPLVDEHERIDAEIGLIRKTVRRGDRGEGSRDGGVACHELLELRRLGRVRRALCDRNE